MSSPEGLRRSSRRVQRKTELYQSDESNLKYNKWSNEEQETLLYCLKVFGHKNIGSISEQLPKKTKEDIRKFLLFAHNEGRKKNATVPNIKYWLDRCKGEMDKTDNVKSNYLYMSSQVIKYLAVDGLLENHPKPENCGDINFVAAYKLLYQALMGYPLQPVNQATADFICDSFNEIKAMRNPSLVSDMLNLIKKKCKDKNETGNGDSTEEEQYLDKSLAIKKPLIVYKRKRPAPIPLNAANTPPLEVVFQEKDVNSSGSTKCYSVTIGGKSEASSLIVPVPVKIAKTDLENAASNLRSNTEFNPLELPDELLQKYP